MRITWQFNGKNTDGSDIDRAFFRRGGVIAAAIAAAALIAWIIFGR